jgi:hypothetical protein
MLSPTNTKNMSVLDHDNGVGLNILDHPKGKVKTQLQLGGRGLGDHP